MWLKKVGAVLAVVSALCAVLASSALAGTAVTDPAAWVQTNGGFAETVGEEKVTCRQTEGQGPFVFKSEILAEPVKVTATGLNCLGAKLKTVLVAGERMALFEGAIEFTGVTVDEPAGCKTPGIKTNALLGDLQMDSAETGKSFLKFTPAAGAGAALAILKLEKCAQAGNFPIKGSVFGEVTDPTGTHTLAQQFAGNETTDAMSSLTLGPRAATLTGEFDIELESGLAWGAESP